MRLKSETNEYRVSTKKCYWEIYAVWKALIFLFKEKAYIYFIFYEKPLDGNFCRIQNLK